MSAEAALYLSGPDDGRAAAMLVAGRPLAFRTLMSAVRAGCPRVWVPVVLRPAVEEAVSATPAARAAVAWLDPGVPRGAAPLLLLPAGALAPAAAAPLLAARPPAVMAASTGRGAPIGTLATGDASALWDEIAAGKAIGDRLERLLTDAGAAPIDGGWYARVAGPDDVPAAEAALDASLGSPIDTGLDRVFHRRLSRPVTRLALRWGLTPNQVTLASLLVGLAAAWCVGQATVWSALAGLALYASAVVLDHADGAVARLTFAESVFGRRLDVIVDTAIHVLMVLAMGATAQQVAGAGALAAVLAAAGVAASALVTQASPGAPSGAAGGALTALGNRDGYYAMLVAFVVLLAARPAALPLLMVLVALGGHAFWLGWMVQSWRRRPPDPRIPGCS